jgi:hypothetical protein
MELITPCNKVRHLNSLENFYIQVYDAKGMLKDEQNTGGPNPLFAFAINQT